MPRHPPCLDPCWYLPHETPQVRGEGEQAGTLCGGSEAGMPMQHPCRGRGSHFACVISFAALLFPEEEAYGLSVSYRSHGRKDEENEGFKKEITKRRAIFSHLNPAL